MNSPIKAGFVNQFSISFGILFTIFSRIFQGTSDFFDSSLMKTVSGVESILTMVTIFIATTIYLKGKKPPYWLVYTLEILPWRKKYYLSCNNYESEVAKKNRFRIQNFAITLDKLLVQTELRSKTPHSIGLDTWLIEGRVPVQETLSKIDQLVNTSLNTTQKAEYADLKLLWEWDLQLTIDSSWYIVYMNSTLVIAGMTLQKKIIQDHFVQIINEVSRKSLSKKEEFEEIQTREVINILSRLIPNQPNRTLFLNKSAVLFTDNFQISLPKKVELETLFIQLCTTLEN